MVYNDRKVGHENPRSATTLILVAFIVRLSKRTKLFTSLPDSFRLQGHFEIFTQ